MPRRRWRGTSAAATSAFIAALVALVALTGLLTEALLRRLAHLVEGTAAPDTGRKGHRTPPPPSPPTGPTLAAPPAEL